MGNIEYCRRAWSANLDDTSQPAGRAMSKALRAVGLTTNAIGDTTRIDINCGWDQYYVHVPTGRVEEMVTELRKDSRVTKISVNSVERSVKKTVEELEKELADFKATVVKLAMKRAKQHDWCEVVQETLTELGLEVPQKRARVVLEFDVDDNSIGIYEARNLIYDMSRDTLSDAIQTAEVVEG